MAGSSFADPQDRLVTRLRERAGDLERRVDSRPAEFDASLSALDAGELFSSGRSTAQDLRRLLDHGGDDELFARAGDIGR